MRQPRLFPPQPPRPLSLDALPHWGDGCRLVSGERSRMGVLAKEEGQVDGTRRPRQGERVGRLSDGRLVKGHVGRAGLPGQGGRAERIGRPGQGGVGEGR